MCNMWSSIFFLLVDVLFFIMDAFAEMMASFLWFLRILNLNSRVEEGVLSAAFCLPKSQYQSVELFRGKRGHSL